MIIKLISLCVLFSSLSFAEPTRQELSQCEKQAHNFGDGRGRDYIPNECYDHFLKLASAQASKKSADGKVEVYGYRNIVFIQDPKFKSKGQNVIAGSYTELNDIVAIALDEINKEIVVLEKSGAVLFFSSVVTGNVAPLRILKNKPSENAGRIFEFSSCIFFLVLVARLSVAVVCSCALVYWAFGCFDLSFYKAPCMSCFMQ